MNRRFPCFGLKSSNMSCFWNGNAGAAHHSRVCRPASFDTENKDAAQCGLHLLWLHRFVERCQELPLSSLTLVSNTLDGAPMLR